MAGNRDKTRAEIMLRFIQPPRAFYLFCEFIHDPKNKFLILVSKDETEVLFFLINSKSYTVSHREEIPLLASECKFLTRNSYLDCRKVFSKSLDQFIDMIADNIEAFDRGTLPNSVIQKIVEVVTNSETIAPRHQKKIIDSLLNRDE